MTKKNPKAIRKLRGKSGRETKATEPFHTDLDIEQGICAGIPLNVGMDKTSLRCGRALV